MDELIIESDRIFCDGCGQPITDGSHYLRFARIEIDSVMPQEFVPGVDIPPTAFEHIVVHDFRCLEQWGNDEPIIRSVFFT